MPKPRYLVPCRRERYQGVGADPDINVDVRVIAATNKDLLKEVMRKLSLDLLYHRLG